MTTPLPEGSLLLHIGPQKTGSTAIQMAMHEARDELAAQGVLYPGDRMRPQVAGWAILGAGSAVGRPVPKMERWDELVAEVRGNTLPRVCVSNEDFGRADEAAVERILAGLGTDDTHLVFVARRLDKMLPSHWQERVKARMTLSYGDFLHHALETPDKDWEARMTWESHDVALVLDRWAKHLPRERMTVIVSDEDDRALVPNTFEDLLGLRRGTLKPPSGKSNNSLTFTQAEALRRLNAMASEQEWTAEQYWKILQGGTVKALRASAELGGPKINGLPQWAYDLVAARSEAQVAAIEAAGVNVIGDPSRLLLRGNVEPAELPAPVEEISLDLLADLVKGAVEGSAALHQRELRARVREVRAETAAASTPSAREALRILARRTRRLGRG